MKIGIVFDDSLDRNDGVQQYIKSLGGWLSRQGHTVHYLVGQSKSDDKTIHSLSRNINMRFNKNSFSMPLSANKSSIKKLLDEQAYDVLHVQMPYSPLMAGKVLSSAQASTVVVGTFHILPYGNLQKVANKTLAVVQKRSLKRLDAICSVSEAAAEFAKSHYGVKTRVIPNMIDVSKWLTPIKPHPGRIVFLGRLVERKGCYELLKAFAELPTSTHAELLIAGDGSQRAKLEKYVQKNNLKGVSFLGFVDEKVKPSLLASAELAVFPSLGGESFGIVLIEAMAAGSGVVIGGNNPGYATVLKPWKDTLVSPRKTKEFSSVLERFLLDKKLRDSTLKQQQKAVKQYDVGVVGEQIVNMYQTALHKHKDVR